jgi:hypothetical protein
MLSLVASTGCASWSSAFHRESDGTFVHKRRGYRIGTPAPLGGVAWEEVDVDGARLSFRLATSEPGTGSGGVASLTLMMSCSEFVPMPSLEARNLRLGLGATRLIFSAPTAHLRAQGWTQAFETDLDDRTAYVESITLVVDRCTYDLVLVAPRAAPDLVRAFSDWWNGFVPPPVAATNEAAEQGSGSAEE